MSGAFLGAAALGLLALQGSEAPVQASLALARKYWAVPKWPLAHAWLAIALRLWGEAVPAPAEEAPPATEPPAEEAPTVTP